MPSTNFSDWAIPPLLVSNTIGCPSVPKTGCLFSLYNLNFALASLIAVLSASTFVIRILLALSPIAEPPAIASLNLAILSSDFPSSWVICALLFTFIIDPSGNDV